MLPSYTELQIYQGMISYLRSYNNSPTDFKGFNEADVEGDAASIVAYLIKQIEGQNV